MTIIRGCRPTNTAPTVQLHVTADMAELTCHLTSLPTVYIRPHHLPPRALKRDEVPVRNVVTVKQVTKELKEAGLPVSAIADMSGVERKTIYNWMDGAGESRPHKTARLHAIYSLLLPGGYKDLSGLYRFWSTPVQGITIKELLLSSDLDEDRVRNVLRELMAHSRLSASRRERVAMPGGVNGFIEGLETSTSI